VTTNDTYCDVENTNMFSDDGGIGGIDAATPYEEDDDIFNYITFSNVAETITIESDVTIGTKQTFFLFESIGDRFMLDFTYETLCDSNSANILVQNNIITGEDRTDTVITYKNQESRVNVLTYANLQAYFAVGESECPIVSYQILNPNTNVTL